MENYTTFTMQYPSFGISQITFLCERRALRRWSVSFKEENFAYLITYLETGGHPYLILFGLIVTLSSSATGKAMYPLIFQELCVILSFHRLPQFLYCFSDKPYRMVQEINCFSPKQPAFWGKLWLLYEHFATSYWQRVNFATLHL